MAIFAVITGEKLMVMMTISGIVGSTRRGRSSEKLAQWIDPGA
jgi:hypothetical protein